MTLSPHLRVNTIADYRGWGWRNPREISGVHALERAEEEVGGRYLKKVRDGQMGLCVQRRHM